MASSFSLVSFINVVAKKMLLFAVSMNVQFFKNAVLYG